MILACFLFLKLQLGERKLLYYRCRIQLANISKYLIFLFLCKTDMHALLCPHSVLFVCVFVPFINASNIEVDMCLL